MSISYHSMSILFHRSPEGRPNSAYEVGLVQKTRDFLRVAAGKTLVRGFRRIVGVNALWTRAAQGVGPFALSVNSTGLPNDH